MWRLADIGLPSLDDEMALFGGSEDDVLARLARAGVTRGALKRGETGPRSLAIGEDKGVGTNERPTFPRVTDVVDTTAAGDSFNAGFLAAFVRGQDEAACMAAGHALSAQVIRHPGAIMPRNTPLAASPAGDPAGR